MAGENRNHVLLTPGLRTREHCRPVATGTAVPLTPSTPAQRQRRDLILDTALTLVEERGPDGFQVRDVVTRSGVALGTIYRYFPSKDYLIVEALARGRPGCAAASRRRHVTTPAPTPRSGWPRCSGSSPRRSSARPTTRVWCSTAWSRTTRSSSSRSTTSAPPSAPRSSSRLADLEPTLAEDVTVVVYSLLTEHIVAVATGRPSVGGTELQLERGIRLLQRALRAGPCP